MVEQKKKRRWPKRIAVASGVIVLLAGILFGMLQTGWAKRKIANTIAKVVGEKTKSEVTIGRLRGTLPFTITLEDTRFEADGKAWLKIDDLSVRPAIYSILRGRVHVYDLSASSVVLDGPPPESEKKEPKPWRESIPEIVIEKISVEEFVLGEDVIGEGAAFRVEGELRAASPSENVRALFLVERTDGRKGKASISAELNGTPSTLDLKAEIEEGNGGIIAKLLGIREAGDLRASIDGKGPLSEWQGDLKASLSGTGEVSAAVEAEIGEGPFDLSESNPRLWGSFDLTLLHETGDLDASGGFRFEDEKFSAENLEGTGAGSRFSGGLEFDFSSRLFSGMLEGTFDDISIIGKLAGEELKGSAQFSVSITPIEGRQDMIVSMEGEHLEGGFGSAEKFALSGALSDIFGHFGGSGEIKVRGFHSDKVEAEILSIAVSGDADELEFKGKASGELRETFEINVSGTVREGELFELNSFEGSYGSIPLKLLQPASFEMRNGSYNLSETALQIGQGKFRTSGSYADEGVDIEVVFEELPAKIFRKAGAPEMTGSASGMLRVEGGLAQPNVEMIIDMAGMKLTHPSCGDIPPVTIHADGKLEEGRLEAKLTVSDEEGVLVDGNCEVPIIFSLDPVAVAIGREGDFSGSLKADSAIGEIVSLLIPEGHYITGDVALDVQASGTIDKPKLSGTVRVDKGGYLIEKSGKAVSGLNLAADFSMEKGMLSVSSLKLESEEGVVAGDVMIEMGEWPWEFRRQSTIDGRLDIAGRIGKYIQMFLPADTSLEGNITAGLDFGGTINAPAISGRIDLEKGAYDSPGTGRIDVTGGADIEVKEGTLSLADIKVDAMDLSISGGMEFAGNGDFPSFNADTEIKGDLSVSGKLDRAAEIILKGERDFRGTIEATVALAGTLGQLDTSGQVLVLGEYEEIERGTVLKDIRAEIEARGEKLILKDLKATDGEEGKIRAKGWMDLDASEDFPFEFKAKIDKATLVRSDDLKATTNGDVTLAGNIRDFLVSGKAETVTIQARLPEVKVPEIRALEIIEINKDGKQEKPLTDKKEQGMTIRLDLGVKIPKRAFVKGYGLDSEWEGELKIKGSIENPEINGELALTRGNFRFVNKKFSLSKGKIFFSGGKPPKPMLDVTAETTTGEITAYIRLSGVLTSPELSFNSSPVLPQDEILARVIFGKDVAKLTPLQALRIAQIVNKLAGGRDAFSFLDSVQDIMGVDWFEINQNGDSSTDTAITAGKYVGGGVYVEVEKSLNAQGGGISVEKEVAPNISVESEVGTKGGAGFGVRWKKDY